MEKKVIELNSTGDPNNVRWEKYQQSITTGTLEENLQTIAGAPAEIRISSINR